LLKNTLVEKLASVQLHPGRLLHYLPDQPMRDPLGGEGCVAIPTPVARSTRSFRLDSDRQINRLTDAAIHLNGQLVSSDSEDLLSRLNWTAEVDSLPREVVLELNTNRDTSPVFWPGKFHSIQRELISIDTAKHIFEQLGDDVRLTLSGVGDPLLHPQVFEIIESARSCGISAIHMETDLLADETAIHRLAESNIDVVSVHLPAMVPATYAAVMGCDRFVEVIENIKRFVTRKLQRNHGVPILVPLFMKTEANLAEMEAWYDQWLKAVNAATITGPSNFAGLIPDAAVADMSPPRRKPCGRLWSRMSIHCDGRVVSCEQDVTARQIVGDANQQSIKEIWQTNFAELRGAHKTGCLTKHPACAACREWHRP
jgi:spiro-SPASM protein